MKSKLYTFKIQTDVPSMYSQLKTYILSIAKDCEKNEPQLSEDLKELLRKDLPEHVSQENFPTFKSGLSFVVKGNSIKIKPLSPLLTQIDIYRRSDSNKYVFNELIRYSEDFKSLMQGEARRIIKPRPNAAREEWFEYYFQNKPHIKITHKDIAEEIHLTHGTTRQQYAVWKKSRA